MMIHSASATEPGFYEGVGRRIVEARTAIDWKQSRLARALGVKEATLSRWETGRLRVSADRIQEIAALTSKPVEWFYAESPATPEPPSVDEALYLLHAAIDREKRRPGVVQQILPPPSPALADVLERLETGATMIAEATRELRHLLTVSERNADKGRLPSPAEENYPASALSESARVAGELAVNLAALLPSDLVVAYAHEMASLTPTEKLAALNALLTFVRDEKRRRGSRGSARGETDAIPGRALAGAFSDGTSVESIGSPDVD